MTPSLIISCFWVLAASVVAVLPMKRLYGPGIALLLAAPLLIIWLAIDFGFFVAVIGVFSFASIFRHPLMFFWRLARGERPKVTE